MWKTTIFTSFFTPTLSNTKIKLFNTAELKSQVKGRSPPRTCTELRKQNTSVPSGNYDINPDYITPNTVAVYCNMTVLAVGFVSRVYDDQPPRLRLLYVFGDRI